MTILSDIVKGGKGLAGNLLSVLKRLSDMVGMYVVRVIKVGDGARNFNDLEIAPGAQIEFFGGS